MDSCNKSDTLEHRVVAPCYMVGVVSIAYDVFINVDSVFTVQLAFPINAEFSF